MAVQIQAGILRHSLYLQENTPLRGNPGTWANVATDPEVRCAIKTLSDSEINSQSGERGQRKIELVMRYRSDVTYAKRFSDGAGRVFDIEQINNVNELNHKLIVTAIERSIQNG